MTGSASALVGRAQEIAALTRLLKTVREDGPRFAQISGEPGIGKTSLLAAVADVADRDGWLVLSGRCSEIERELPFALVIDTFDDYLASTDQRDFERIAAEELTELAGVFPSLRSLAPESTDLTTATERFRVHRAIVEMMARLAARKPLLLLLDDIHWADGASIEQAAYVLNHPPDAPVMIVGSFRIGQADPALVTAVESAAREGRVERFELGPLAPADARELVGDEVTDVYEASGGNPFYLLELARIGAAKGPPEAPDEGVPAAVAASIASELELLSPTARALVNAAGVAGDPFDLDVASATADLDDGVALSAIDELLARDLIRLTPVPRRFQFRHPLLRSAVYERCPQGVRLAAHEKVSSILASQGAPASERAHHVVHAARHGDLDAVDVLRTAGRESLSRAPRSAELWFSGALRLLPADADSEERLDLLMSVASASAAVGRFEQSHKSLLSALPLAGGDGAIPRVPVIAACANIEQLLGKREQAHARLTEAIAGLGEGVSPERAALLVELAVDGFYGARWDVMRDCAVQALEISRRLGDPTLVGVAAAVSAFATACTGPVDEAIAHRAEAATQVDSQSDEELARRLDACAWLSSAEYYLDLYESGLTHAKRGLAIARSTGQGELIPPLIQALANLMFTTGNLRQSNELLDEAVDAARLSGNWLALAWSLLNRGFAGLLEGDMETARRSADEAWEVTADQPEAAVAAWAGAIAVGVATELGEHSRAIEALEARCGGRDASLIPGAWRAVLLSWATESWLALGEDEEATRSVELARDRAEEFPIPTAQVASTVAEARVKLASGRPREAWKRAQAGAKTAESAGARLESARCRALAGEALAAAGEKESAVIELQRAAAEFDACGATRYREKAERQLGKLGSRAHRRTRAGAGDGSGVESLTGRELEIARLVVDRYTNPEIAAELFLSVKTVETHMRNIFRKLDVDSRVEVARTVESAGKD